MAPASPVIAGKPAPTKGRFDASSDVRDGQHWTASRELFNP